MIGFTLLLGHLFGDYILQNDWMAKDKTLWGNEPSEEWAQRVSNTGHLACTIHCLLYTLVVYVFTCWWMPWWAPFIVFLAHWPVDRFRLARWWMINVSQQKEFATGSLSPWSVIIVDNIAHLFVLFCLVPGKMY